MIDPFAVTEHRCVSGFLAYIRFLQAVFLANILSRRERRINDLEGTVLVISRIPVIILRYLNRLFEPEPLIFAVHRRHYGFQTLRLVNRSSESDGSELAFRWFALSSEGKLQFIKEETYTSNHNLRIRRQILLLRLGEEQFYLEFLE